MKTRLSALAAAVSSLSMLTACGGGGGSGEVPEYTPPYVPSWTTAEGMWDGTMSSGRALSGVVTDGRESWLVYSAVGNSSIPSGFYYGSAPFVKVSDTAGTYSPQSPQEFEFNFEGGGKKSGGLVANYNITDGYTSANYLNGDFTELPPTGTGTTYGLTMSANVYFPTAQGFLIMEGFTGVWDSTTKEGSWSGTTSIPGFETTLWYDQNFYMNEGPDPVTVMLPDGPDPDNLPDPRVLNEGFGVLQTLFNCGANTVSACQGFSGALQGTWKNTQGSGPTVNNDSYKKAYGFTPADGLAVQWTLQVFKPTGQTDASGNPILDYTPMPMSVTLRELPPGTSLTADSFTTTYNDLYEETSSLATLAGSYTASPAYTGIESTLHTDTTTLSISSNGAISGAETNTGCAYSGTVARRRRGNVYDATGLTFTGGSCPYTASGTFSGVVTYDAGALTLTAMNDAKDKGFMVVASKP